MLEIIVGKQTTFQYQKCPRCIYKGSRSMKLSAFLNLRSLNVTFLNYCELSLTPSLIAYMCMSPFSLFEEYQIYKVGIIEYTYFFISNEFISTYFHLLEKSIEELTKGQKRSSLFRLERAKNALLYIRFIVTSEKKSNESET